MCIDPKSHLILYSVVPLALELDEMWKANLLTIVLTIVIKFQSIAEVINTLVVRLVRFAGFFESFVAFGKGSLDRDTAKLSAVDVLYIC